MSDGEPPFTSEEFQLFLRYNGVKHIVTAPYHPASDGAAENAVKTVKKTIKKAAMNGENIEKALCKFLIQYRNTAHATTQKPPSLALLGRTLRTRLDIIRGCTADHVTEAEQSQIKQAGGAYRTVDIGDPVFIRDYSKNTSNKWKPGTLVERTGVVTYKVRDTNDTISTKHVDQVVSRKKKHSLSAAISTDSKEDNRTSLKLPSPDTADNLVSDNNKIIQPRTDSPTSPSIVSPKPRYNLRPRHNRLIKLI